MIGLLKNRVTIEEAVRTPDGGGGFAQSWQAIPQDPEVYAVILPLSGAEQLRHHQLQSTVTHSIIIRHRGDVTPAMRIVKGATVYDIISLTERPAQGQAGQAYLEILAAVRIP